MGDKLKDMTKERTGIAAIAMALFAVVCAAQQATPPAPSPTVPSAQERALIEEALTPLPAKVQVAVALVDGDAVRFLGAERTAEGIRYLDNRESVFEIGSITKVFTATLLARQVERGALRLDQPVQELLPFALKAPGRDGVQINLKHLASHTSGMRHQPPGIGLHAKLRGHSKDPFWDFDRAAFRKYLEEDMKLDFTPGTKYQYSNMGMSLTGLVLTVKTGKRYEELLQEEIFGPLGMSHSSSELAKVKDEVVPGILKEGEESPNWDMGALAPAGNVKTCAEDFAKFAQAQFAPDAAMAMTQQPVFTIEDGYHVGLGWHVIDRKNGERWLNHGGGMGGYTAIVNVNVKRRLAAVVLSNLGNGHKLAERISDLGRGLMKAMEAAPAEPPKGAASPPVQKETRMDLGKPRTALLVVDIQNDYFKGGVLPLAGSDEAAERARKVIDAFGAAGYPVIHIRHESKGPGLFAPNTQGQKIEKRVLPLPGEGVFTKHGVNSFEGTPLLDYLHKQGIERLVITGMQTDVCVLGAVKGAEEHGLETIVLTDATAAVSEERREKTLPTLASDGAKLMTVSEFLEAVKR